eukprot:09421.XXX_422986_423237_1 [CDS] Oithona nana genome sequencing.
MQIFTHMFQVFEAPILHEIVDCRLPHPIIFNFILTKEGIEFGNEFVIFEGSESLQVPTKILLRIHSIRFCTSDFILNVYSVHF